MISRELPKYNSSSQRKRKPDKSSICHLVPEVILHEDPEGNVGLRPNLPELTITPTYQDLRMASSESMESLSGVMRVRPQRALSRPDNGLGSQQNSQVK